MVYKRVVTSRNAGAVDAPLQASPPLTLPGRRAIAFWPVLAGIVIVLLAGVMFASGLTDVRAVPRASAASRGPLASASLARVRHRAALREAQHRRWLGSAAAVSQRVASRMAFHDLSESAASGLLLRDFGSALRRADSAPSVSLVTRAPVVRYLGAYQAMVRGPKGPRYINSMLPLAHMLDGRERPIDLQLKGGPAGFTPVNAPDGVSIARDLAGGVSLGSAAVGISMEGRNVEGALLDSSSAFFRGVARDVDATVTPTDSGVELFATLRSRLSPEELRYRLSLPSGAGLRVVGGGVDVWRAGRVLASISPPTAVDAQGQDVPVRMAVDGDQLVLRVAHRARDYAYPILVDPKINKEEGLSNWTFQQGEYTHEEFQVRSEGPFVQKNPGGFEVPKGADTESLEGKREARWLWQGPSGLRISEVAFLYSEWEEPEGKLPLWSSNVVSGCGSAPPFRGTGQASFSDFEHNPQCPATNQIEIHWTALPYKSLPGTLKLFVNAIWITEIASTRSSSEDFGARNPGEPNIPRVSCGKPINCATGNEFYSHTDLSIGGSPGLKLTRAYNSQLAAEQTSPSPFGYGWSSSYGASLSFTKASGSCPESKILCTVNVVIVHQDNGSTVPFEESSAGWLAAGPCVQATLKERFPNENYEYTLPDGAVFEFNKAGRLTSATDTNGNVTALTYNEKNQLTKAEEGAGRAITFVPNSEGLVTETKDLLGSVKYTYASGNLTEVTDADKHVWKYGYGTSHQMTSQTDPLSHTTAIEYDSSHRVIAEEDPLKRKRTWKYVTSESGTETTVTNPSGSVTVEHYSKANLPESITDAYGTSLAATTTYEYGVADNLIAVTDPNKHTTKYTYDYGGDRTSETNADEDTTEWGYSRFYHELLSRKTPGGEETTFSNNPYKQPVTVTRPAPGSETQTTKYKYDSKGDLESIEDPLKRVWKYEYDAYGDRVAEIDPEGNKRTWTYNEASQEISSTSPRGNAVAGEAARFTTKTEHDAESRVLSRTEPLGEPVYKFQFGSSGSGAGQFQGPTSDAVDSSGNVWVNDREQNRIEKFSASGTFIQAMGFGVSNGEAKYEICTATCREGIVGSGSGQFNKPSGITVNQSTGNVYVGDSANNRVEEFSSSGTFLKSIGSSGSGLGQLNGPTQGTIDASGDLWVVDYGNSRFEEFSAEGAAMLVGGWGVKDGKKETEVCTATCQAGIAGSGAGQFFNPQTVAISEGNVYVDDRGNNRIEEFSSTGVYIRLFGATGTGNGQFSAPFGIATNPANGNLYVADKGNSRVQEFTPSGAFILSFGTSGTGSGQLNEPKGIAVTAAGSLYVVDAGNTRVEEWTVSPRVTKYSYDAAGNLEAVTDPNGNTTKYTYDADNEPTKTEEPNSTVTETGYDSMGHVTSQTDGKKHTTEYKRNLLEEVTEEVDPLGRKTKKEYDAAGNLKTLEDPAKRTTTYTYDPANRLKEVSYSDGKTHAAEYEYNKDGAVTQMKDGSGTTKYTYDQLDRLTENENGHKETVKYEYNLSNEPTKLTYPNGKAVTRAYDKDDRLEKVTDWLEHATTFGYDPDSDLASTTYPSETKDEDKYAYNETDQLNEAKMTKGTETLALLHYTRDNDGQVKTAVSNGLPGEEKLAYEYDPNSRLVNGAGAAYEYDAANNPTKQGSSSYSYDATNELEKSTGYTYTYNEVGQRTKTTPTTGPATTYGYDQAGSLTSAERPKEGTTPEIKDAYAYNGEDLRTSQTISGTTSYLAWDPAEGLPLILNDGTNSYIYGVGRLPVEQITSGGTVTYLHHDQQGSTRLLTGSTGTVTGKCSYGAYGTPTCEGTTTTPLGYDAQYTNTDTGLIYMRARTYDPATAQFLSVDPAVALTREPYAYGGDNPVNRRDPDGLSAEGLEGVPCYFPFCGPPPPAVEGVQHGIEGITHGIESVWNSVNENEGPNDEGEAALHEKEAERENACDPTPPGYDPETWTKGPASRAKEPDENYYDPEGGEWHYHAPDRHHEVPHWDYKRLPGKLAPWEEIPVE